MLKRWPKLKTFKRYYSLDNRNSKPPTFFHGGNVPDKHENSKGFLTKSETNAETIPIKHVTLPTHFQNSTVDSSKAQYNYRDFFTGLTYLSIGLCLVYIVIEQREKNDENERQLKLLRKKHREVIVQTQTFKNKLSKVAVENSRKNLMVQGKMQIHIALLKEQLLKAGLDPVSVEEAIQTFEEKVKVETSNEAGGRVDLWIPGDDEIKKLVPDPKEYKSMK